MMKYDTKYTDLVKRLGDTLSEFEIQATKF